MLDHVALRHGSSSSGAAPRSVSFEPALESPHTIGDLRYLNVDLAKVSRRRPTSSISSYRDARATTSRQPLTTVGRRVSQSGIHAGSVATTSRQVVADSKPSAAAAQRGPFVPVSRLDLPGDCGVAASTAARSRFDTVIELLPRPDHHADRRSERSFDRDGNRHPGPCLIVRTLFVNLGSRLRGAARRHARGLPAARRSDANGRAGLRENRPAARRHGRSAAVIRERLTSPPCQRRAAPTPPGAPT